MHDILEGVLQYEVKLLLHVMIEEEGYFSLDYFNSRLENLELGYMECQPLFQQELSDLLETLLNKQVCFEFTYTYVCIYYIQL